MNRIKQVLRWVLGQLVHVNIPVEGNRCPGVGHGQAFRLYTWRSDPHTIPSLVSLPLTPKSTSHTASGHAKSSTQSGKPR
jgi:hypothetical protein